LALPLGERRILIMNRQQQPVPLGRVTIDDAFWAPRLETNRTVTLPIEYEQLKATGRIDAFRLNWREGQPNRPHQFWDSDVAKWLEAVGYSLATHPDEDMESLADSVIDLVASAQQPDGYLNIYYSVVAPGQRWTNLRDMHELYCAGHLMEAAVAYYESTGKRRLLEVLCRYADHIATVFGPGEGQKRGYPGHEEIELGLVKLYRATGEKRYLELARFFVDERGREPHFFDQEALARGDDPAAYRFRDHSYTQSHLPVERQTTVEGHAVRAMYLFSGATDVALETGNEGLLTACERVWANVAHRRMYVTGGIGSTAEGERFTYDYDLPNASAYAETCAAIGLVFWAHRMLQARARGEYGDVMERALYNGVLSGVSLDGRRFFYSNPLEVNRRVWEATPESERRNRMSPERQEWFGCACCPPNIARLLASLGQYIYSTGKNAAYVHLYVGSRVTLDVGDRRIGLRQTTDYPWEGTVRLTVESDGEQAFLIGLRMPAWCRQPAARVNGQAIDLTTCVRDGYAMLHRVWHTGDVIELDLPMRVERVHAHPNVWTDCGRVALQWGPLVYCLEEEDNQANLDDLALPADAELVARREDDLLGGVVTIRGEAWATDPDAWGDALYRTGAMARERVPLKAVPYYAWANRGLGSMQVWLREG